MSEAALVQVQVRPDLSEQVSYDVPGFPVYLRNGILSHYPDYAALCHWHEDIELIYICSGEMEYRINEETIHLTEGTGLFVNARQLHFGFSPEHRECHFLCLILHPRLLCTTDFMETTFVRPVLEHPTPYLVLSPEVPWQAEMNLQIQSLYALSHTSHAQLQILAAFCTLWQTLYSHLPDAPSGPVPVSHDLMLMRSLLQFIDDTYADPISMQSLADSAHISISKCYDLFHHYLAQTPLAYLQRYRLEKSLRLLTETDDSITEIAAACGFGGASYYAEVFRRYYGETPRAYRKRFRLHPASPVC